MKVKTRFAGLLLVVIGAASLAPPAQAGALTPAQIAEQATPSVVLIRTGAGLGTGFVASDDGRIVTNVHVIRGASQATVVTSDGHEFKDIEVMAADETHDVVVLRIHAKGLRALALGDSSAARPGEHVVAIGHPLGLGNTVSDGLISAIRELKPKQPLLQISAPISPGSSGGPLFNDLGQVIGISTLVITGGQNLNFAVPINVVKPLLAAEKGVTLAAYAAQNERHRSVPTYSTALLDECPAPQLKTIVGGIEQAIKLGAPLYNKGNIEACYRIYASAALDANRRVEACPRIRRALVDGVDNAGKADGWTDKAWVMRDAFDGVLAVARTDTASSATPSAPTAVPRAVPHHERAVLDGCDPADVEGIHEGIVAAIGSGAPLYNSGDIEACFRIYEGAIDDIDRSIHGCPAAKKALHTGLETAERNAGWDQKAWALRDAFDGLTEVIERGTSDRQ